MKYSYDSAVSEIMKRSRNLKLKRAKNLINALSFAVLLTFVSATALGYLIIKTERSEGLRTVYGSFLLPGSAGGYVLAGVVSFTLGVALTLFLLWRRRKSGGDASALEEPKEDSDAKE